MSNTVTFPAAIGGSDITITDDADPATGLADNGHLQRFVPAMSEVVAVASHVVEKAEQVNQLMPEGAIEQVADNAAQAALDAAAAEAAKNIALQSSLNQLNWQVKTADFVAAAGGAYYVDTTANPIVCTLPSSPAGNNWVKIVDIGNYLSTNKLTLARNGEKISSLTEDADVKTNLIRFTVSFIDTARGWWPAL